MVPARSADLNARRAEAYSGSQFERVLSNSSRLAIVFIGIVALVFVLRIGQVILAPVWLAVIVGLMFGPLADTFERRGVAPALSAALVVLLFIALIGVAIMLFAVPLSDWIGRIPEIWAKLQVQLVLLRQPLQSLTGLESQLSNVFGGSAAMPVRLEEGSAVVNIALIAPEIGAEILLFLASLYFFLATRESFRVSILSLCVTRRMRWRTAHVFSDVEEKVSRFLVSVSILNAGVGVAVALATWALGMPSPLLWGALAMVLNYVPYIGQAVMILILTAVGLGTQTDLVWALLPVGCYVVITLIEGQFVTPQFLGRTMTINPFLILLSTALALWIWGPVGGIVSVPSLLIVQSVLMHVLPSRPVRPRRPVIRTAGMSERDEILANAARVIKERNKARQTAEKEPPQPEPGVRDDGVPTRAGTA